MYPKAVSATDQLIISGGSFETFKNVKRSNSVQFLSTWHLVVPESRTRHTPSPRSILNVAVKEWSCNSNVELIGNHAISYLR